MAAESHRGVQMSRALRIDLDPPRLVHADSIPANHKKWRELSRQRRLEGLPPALQCEDASCTAAVTPVYSAPQETTPRAPFFRKWPKTPHATRCVYNVEHRIDVIVEASDGLIEQLPRQRGVLRYRLVVPDALSTPHPARDGVGDDDRFLVQSSVLLNTAAKIAGLIQEYEERRADPHMEWSATCRGQNIAWDDFFYAPPRIHTLHRRVGAHRLPHPVAVLTPIAPPQGTGDAYRWCRAFYVNPDQRWPQPLFVDGPRDVVDRIRSNHECDEWVVAFGMWTAQTHRSDTRPPRLTLTVSSDKQVALIDDPRVAKYLSRLSWPIIG